MEIWNWSKTNEIIRNTWKKKTLKVFELYLMSTLVGVIPAQEMSLYWV